MVLKEIKAIPIRELEEFNKDEFNVESWKHCPLYLSELDAKQQLDISNAAEKLDEICFVIVKLADGSWRTVTHYLNQGHIGFILFNACYVPKPTPYTIHAVAYSNEAEKKYHTDIHLIYKKGKAWY